ncbi:hypothetical protein F2Q69_00057926 [Brassica cretica]|uniref:Uncharacterized protein n=1 Tax=Brassica cretica TaxID=69181 RepID=A0A8S9MYC2_BRACR|nr:hypothetical protein F2Q69_00057926 [Brassica cretica]
MLHHRHPRSLSLPKTQGTGRSCHRRRGSNYTGFSGVLEEEESFHDEDNENEVLAKDCGQHRCGQHSCGGNVVDGKAWTKEYNIVDEGCVDVIAVDEQTGDKNIVDEGYVDVIAVDEQIVDKRILEE